MKRAPRQGNYIEINGMSQYYEDAGSGTPLILLHGGSSTHEEWNAYVPGFENNFHVFLPDTRGHGRSDNPLGVLSYAQMADDLAEFCHSLSLEKPFIAGWSDGGQVALNFAVRYPGLARAAIIGGATWQWTEHTLDMIHSMGIKGPGNVDFPDLEKNIPEMIETWKSMHESIYGADYWKELLVQISYLWFFPLGFDPESLGKIEIPVLILCGDRGDVITPSQAVEMYHYIPGSELCILPGADHFVTEFRPQLISSIFMDFFNRHISEVT